MSSRIRWMLSLALIAALATFSGCGGGGGSSEAGTPLQTRTLSWQAPTSYADTTTMDPVTDLDRFEIYVNETGSFTDADTPMAALGAVDPATHRLITSFNLANLYPHVNVGPHYYVSLRAVALTGLKSDFSPPVPFSF